MIFIYLLISYIVGSIPGIAFFAGNIDNLNKKTVIVIKKGITVSYYPGFGWQWLFLSIDILKFFFFYYLISYGSIAWIIGLTLGQIFPFWNPKLHRSTTILLLIFLFSINPYLALGLLVIEAFFMLTNKDLQEIPIIISSLLLAIFYWVSGADIYFVLIALVFLVFSVVRFTLVNSKNLFQH